MGQYVFFRKHKIHLCLWNIRFSHFEQMEAHQRAVLKVDAMFREEFDVGGDYKSLPGKVGLNAFKQKAALVRPLLEALE